MQRGLAAIALGVPLNVAILASFASLLVACSALQLRQYRSLLVAIGFGSIGGIFAVHGLATPGVLLRSGVDDPLAGRLALAAWG